MSDNPDTHHRRSIRLQHYDYASPGGYFVTLCSHERQCLFGEIWGSEMRLNGWGKIIREEWLRTPILRPNVELDEYVIMPNHVHGIIIINAACKRIDDGAHVGAPVQKMIQSVGADRVRPVHDSTEADTSLQPIRRRPDSLGSIIAGFKSAVTRRINELHKTPGAPVWHRNYYEQVIRNEENLGSIREYIVNNPQKWHEDENNPERKIPPGIGSAV